jgi:type I restriction enzyme S subunit
MNESSAVKPNGAAELRRFKPYPAYRDSGVEWLGQTPAHWQVKRLKSIASVQLSNVDKKSAEGEEPVRLCNYVDVYYNERITADLDFMSATATPEQIRRFSLRGGDVLITKDSESWTDIAVPAVVAEDLPGVICGYHLAHIRPEVGYHGAFLAHAFSAIGPRDQFQVSANGITRFGLGGDAIRTGLFPIPPEPEQRAIAAFLDRETAKVDALVAEKQRLIALLQEKCAALITRAVTKGLDPNVPMKDSGYEWLGEIPAHWEVKELRRLNRKGTSITYGIVQAGPDVEGGVPYIRTSDMAGEELPKTGYLRAAPEIDAAYRRSKVATGDVVVAIRATVGKALMVPDYLDGANLTQGTAKVSPGDRVDGKFLLAALRSEVSEQRFEAIAKGATFREITLDMLRRLPVAVPPLTEQAIIVDFIEAETTKTNVLVKAVRTVIDHLKEMRNALISAAVTGKIDVREEAA